MIKFVRKLLTAADVVRRAEVQAALAAVAIAAMLVAVVSDQPVRGQVPSVVGPFNVDMGALITNTNQGAGVVNSTNQNNLDQGGATCTFIATAMTGQPFVNFSIQGLDNGTGAWTTYVTSQSVSIPALASTVTLYPFGNPVVNAPFGPALALPSNAAVTGLPLPRFWRVQELVQGSGTPTVTGKIGCVLLK